jgi:hypothetical protein
MCKETQTNKRINKKRKKNNSSTNRATLNLWAMSGMGRKLGKTPSAKIQILFL